MYAQNHPVISWVQFRGNNSMHLSEIDCRKLGSNSDERKKNDVTEYHGGAPNL